MYASKPFAFVCAILKIRNASEKGCWKRRDDLDLDTTAIHVFVEAVVSLEQDKQR